MHHVQKVADVGRSWMSLRAVRASVGAPVPQVTDRCVAAAAAAAYLSYELDDLDEDVERGVPGDHATGALGEQSRHDAQETAVDTRPKTFTLLTHWIYICDDEEMNTANTDRRGYGRS